MSPLWRWLLSLPGVYELLFDWGRFEREQSCPNDAHHHRSQAASGGGIRRSREIWCA